MSSPLVTSLFSQLGEAFGLSSLAPDENGYCSVQVDEKFPLHFMVSDDQESLTVFSELGRIDPESQPEIVLEILSANLFWRDTRGSTLGIEPASGSVVLLRQLEVQTLTYPGLESVLDGFIKSSEHWLNKISSPKQAASSGEEEALSGTFMPGLRP